LLPRLVETKSFEHCSESVASEQGARNDGDGCGFKERGDLISSLTLNMNRVRQAATPERSSRSFPALRHFKNGGPDEFEVGQIPLRPYAN